ncbi:hypothetical protein CM15mP43_11880 [bacterium]|nr:MAG: hypothetical protein CM15mP43_11880 [bacterium]
MKVILKDVPNSTVSSVFIWVKTGSAYENDYERGLAHVHEHMIFKGTSKLGVGEISKKLSLMVEMLMLLHLLMKPHIMPLYQMILSHKC